MAFRPDAGFRAFRIADHRHPIFDGTGSYLNGARWTSKGRRVIYAAETYAGALLEVLVHSNLGRVGRSHSLIEITVPSAELIEQIDARQIPGWELPDLAASRQAGDLWYQQRRTPVLLVPSLVTQGVEHNVLVNEEHSLFPAILSGPAREVSWDERLFRSAIERQ